MTLKPMAAGLALALALAGTASFAQNYPSKPIRIVVPYATGGGSDILARQISASLQKNWNAAVAVENKAGASGNIGSQDVARATPDGYTLLLQNSTMVTNLAVQGKLPYDPEKDLTPIMLLGVTPIALAAHPSSHITDLKSLIAEAKRRPLSYGSCGIGTPQHFVMEIIKQKASIDAAHAGYKGCAPAVTDVLGNQIPLAIVSANLVAPYAKNKKLNVVGVSTGTRYAAMPEARSFAEQGLAPFDYSIWYALMGPAKLPQPIVDKLAKEIQAIVEAPEVRERLSNAGVEPLRGDGAALARVIREDMERYSKLAKSMGIQAD